MAMKKKKRLVRESSRILANKELAEALEVARSERGLTDIAERMTKLADRIGATRDRFCRQEVFAWLHPDPDKRVEPRLGIGLMLAHAAEWVARNRGKEKSKKTLYGSRKIA